MDFPTIVSGNERYACLFQTAVMMRFPHLSQKQKEELDRFLAQIISSPDPASFTDERPPFSWERQPYSQYLQSPQWNKTRKRALHRVGFRCQLCNAHDTVLHVHHRNYSRLGSEKPADLLVLCKNCHEKFHREIGMPTT